LPSSSVRQQAGHFETVHILGIERNAQRSICAFDEPCCANNLRLVGSAEENRRSGCENATPKGGAIFFTPAVGVESTRSESIFHLT
jgi:hypothetical protein